MKVKITTDGKLKTRLELNGTDISHGCRQVRFICNAGEVPRVLLELVPDEMEIDGVMDAYRIAPNDFTVEDMIKAMTEKISVSFGKKKRNVQI